MIILMDVDIETLKRRIEYNQTDMGEMGKYIRVEYVFNFLDEAVRNWLVAQEER